MFKGGQMEESGVLVSFFQPVYSWSLFPKVFFLSNDVMQIRKDSLFLLPVMNIVFKKLYFFLDRIKLISFLIFLLENVAKVKFVPGFYVPFHIFQFLGNFEHSSSIELNVPPRRNFPLQRQVGGPHFLKMKREGPFTCQGGNRERNRGVIRANSGEEG